MRRIEAIIPPHRVQRVVAALHALDRFPGFTVIDTRGQGRGHGVGGHYQHAGLLYDEHRLLIVYVEDGESKAVCDAILAAAHTGNAHDGIVVVSDVLSLTRIREWGSAQ